MMETLPLELHAQIFEYACLDDGTAALTLSLVSRYVREVSEPFRYQSLAVAGLDALIAFSQTLGALPAHKRRVRRLFLSDWTRKQALAKVVSSADADMDRYDLEKSTVMRILDVVAPTLESLSFISTCPFNGSELIGYLFSLHLPRLHTLAIHGYYPFPHIPDAMPRLESLRLSGNRNPHGLLQLGGLSTSCPKLRKLHVSGLISTPSFADEAQSALVPGVDGASYGVLGASLPASIRHITFCIGPRPSNPARRYASARLKHQKMTEIMDGLKGRSGSEQDIVVDVMEEREDGVSAAYDVLRAYSRQ